MFPIYYFLAPLSLSLSLSLFLNLFIYVQGCKETKRRRFDQNFFSKTISFWENTFWE